MAFPLTTELEPRTTAPFLKVTVPVAEFGVIVALKVTSCPKVDGLGDDASAVELLPRTICVNVPDVPPAKLASPE